MAVSLPNEGNIHAVRAFLPFIAVLVACPLRQDRVANPCFAITLPGLPRRRCDPVVPRRPDAAETIEPPLVVAKPVERHSISMVGHPRDHLRIELVGVKDRE